MATNLQNSVDVNENSSNGDNNQLLVDNKWKQISPFLYQLTNQTNASGQYEQKVNAPPPLDELESINPIQNLTISKNKKKKKSKSMETSKNNHLKNVDLNLDEHADDIEVPKQKTPITLLNEWAMREGNDKMEKIVVTYNLVALDGLSHRPKFTFMCLVNNNKVTGTGFSKKEAKHAAAAKMLEMLLKDNSMASSDKIITSTTANDNFDTNENDTENLTNIEGSQQIVDEPDLVISSDIKVEYVKNDEAVKLSHCQMNPIGALQELSVYYKCSSPIYTFHRHLENNITVYQVMCRIFNLQTTATANRRKTAKTMAAHMMCNQLNGMPTDLLQELKSFETQITSHYNGYKQNNNICTQEDSKESYAWDAIKMFKLYFKEMVANTMGWSKLCSLLEDDTEQKFEQNEQSIIQHNSDSTTAVEKLQTLCVELSFETIYVHVNSILPQKADDDYSSQTEEHTIILQVNTIPVTVTIGRAETFNMAKELAARCVLKTFKTMFLPLSI